MITEKRQLDEESRGRVLVVDDDRDFAMSLRNFLTLEGYHVETTYSAEEALEAIEEFDAQVAILDYRLGPNIGIDLVSPLKRRRPELVCILATAYTELDTAIKALRKGAYDYFGKPLNTDELLATLDRCFEKLRLEQAERAAEEAGREVEKMRAVAQVAGGVAHHSNNLLMVILANIERLKLCVQSDTYALTLTDEMERAVDRAADINRSLLAFTRQNILRPRTIDVQMLVSDVLESVRPELGATIRVKVTVPDDIWEVRADPAQFKSTLLALAQNAVEAMPRRGTLSIEAANLEQSETQEGALQAPPAGSYVVIAVSDTGTGMPPEIVERAFEPFFSNLGLTEKMGLGLSMAYGFVNQSGGRITMESEMGRGTTVRLYLPRLMPLG